MKLNSFFIFRHCFSNQFEINQKKNIEDHVLKEKLKTIPYLNNDNIYSWFNERTNFLCSFIDPLSYSIDTLGDEIRILVFDKNSSGITLLASGLTKNASEWGNENPFVAFTVNSKKKSVHIQNDGVGWIPTFYFFSESENCIYISNSASILTKLSQKATWSKNDVFDYLVFKHTLEDRTVFTEIKKLKPAVNINLTDISMPESNLNPIFFPLEDQYFTSKEEALDAFSIHWSRAIKHLSKRKSYEHQFLGLSGGYDSRSILSEIANQGLNISSITYSFSKRDYKYAVMVADRLGIINQPIEINNMLDFDLREGFFMTEYGQSICENFACWGAATLPIGVELIEGVSGDVFFGNVKYAKKNEDLFSSLRKTYSKQIELTLMLFEESKKKELYESFLGRLEDSVKKVATFERFNQGLVWNLINRQSNWGFSNQRVLWNMGFGYTNPFFTSDFLNFGRRIPPSLRSSGILYREIHLHKMFLTSDIPHSSCFIASASDLVSGLYSEKSLLGLLNLAMSAFFSKLPYSGFKLLGEFLVQIYMKKIKRKSLILSPSNLFSHSEKFRKKVIQLFSERADLTRIGLKFGGSTDLKLGDFGSPEKVGQLLSLSELAKKVDLK
jgi:hypothetical protein